MTHAIRTENLGRIYRRPRKRWSRKSQAGPSEFVALQDVNLEVRPGELFGLLGPNGAGKTTLIKILTTLLAPSSGQAWVDGHDVINETDVLRPKINMVSGGETSGYGILNVVENLWLFARIYGVPTAVIQDRIETMLDVVDLRDKAQSRVSQLSTGQRQKMNFCRGFITDPKILFLDEPTLGLDVTSARAIRKFVKRWIAERPERTLLLTTHYMAEAEELCDRIAIIDHGKVLACDTPTNLKRQVQEHEIYEISLAPNSPTIELNHLSGVHQSSQQHTPSSLEIKVLLQQEAAIGQVVQQVVEQHGKILKLNKVEPSLEDVFLELVGHGLDSSGTGS